MSALDLARRYVLLSGRLVQERNFDMVLDLFHPDAELIVEDPAPAGPFRGRAAIGEALRARAPLDTIMIVDASEEGSRARIVYGWRKALGVRAGVLELEVRGELIARLAVKKLGPSEETKPATPPPTIPSGVTPYRGKTSNDPICDGEPGGDPSRPLA